MKGRNAQAHSASKAPSGTTSSLAAQNSNRHMLIIQNVHATVDVFIGGPDVAATGPSRGFLLKSGQTPPAEFRDDQSAAEWFGVTAGGTGDVTVTDAS